MPINEIRIISSIRTPDDTQLPIIRRDLSGGINNRQSGTLIGENQMTVLYNVDIGIVGQSSKRAGSVLIGNDVSNNTFMSLFNYARQGYTDSLIAYDDTVLWEWLGTGNWAATGVGTLTTGATDVGILACKESGLVPDDVFIVQNGTDDAQRFHKASNGVWAVQDLLHATGANAGPVKSTVMCWYGNRVWILKNDLLYFSDAYPADYAVAFDDVSNMFRIPVGAERGLCATRDTGIVVLGEDAIWGIAPSVVPAATDKPEPLITNHGVVSKKGWCQAGDDIYYFAQDGFRALKRTLQDKLQSGVEFPISYPLKDEYERIAWAYIDRLAMKYYDNKIFISVPTSATAFDTWVYYTALKSFVVFQGWSPRCWETYKVGGVEYLYYGKQGNGVAYRAFSGYTDEGTTTTNGTAINYQEEGRKEDMGQPLIKKVGGVIKIKALSSGNYDLAVSVSIDDQAYVSLGVVNLMGNSPVLPLDLPFTLASGNIITGEFHLDSLGEFDQIRLKIVHNAANGADAITILERQFISYPTSYQDEV
jgi:hypothetical protein